MAQPVSGNGVKVLAPAGAIAPTGTWSVGARAGDYVFVAGMRGIDPNTNALVEGDEARIRQAFLRSERRIAALRASACTTPFASSSMSPTWHGCGRWRHRFQEELWAGGPYPPRTNR